MAINKMKNNFNTIVSVFVRLFKNEFLSIMQISHPSSYPNKISITNKDY